MSGDESGRIASDRAGAEQAGPVQVGVSDEALWRAHPLPRPGKLQLALGEVQLWKCDRDQVGPTELECLSETLSPEERQQAAKFVRDCDRLEHVVSHGALRCLAAGYLDVPAQSVRFERGEHGKPRFVRELNPLEVGFNISHSRGSILLGFARGEVVGVDVERHRPMRDAGDLARRFFHPREARLLERLSPDARERAFFRCWTRKEAVVKCVGLPVAVWSGSVAVLSSRTLRPVWPAERTIRLGLAEGEPVHRLRWTDLPLGDHRSGAVAYSGSHARLSLRRIDWGWTGTTLPEHPHGG